MAKSEKPEKEMTAQYTVAKSFDKFGAGIKIDLILHDSFIEFRSAGKKPVTAILEYRHIMDVEYGSRAEIVKVKKSVVLRAVEGYLIGGKTGSHIGMATAMQGGGTANKQVVVNYFVIGYHGKDQKENFVILIDKTKQKGRELANRVHALACYPTQEK